MYCFRLLALASTTVCGVLFLGSVFVLASVFNYTARHFPLFVSNSDFVETALFGLGFFGSATVYALLARKPTGSQRDRSMQGAYSDFFELVRFGLPAHAVDATSSSALIRQYLCGRTICLAVLG
jgi:hypothetical protein